MKKYYPILISKEGEMVCLRHLTQEVKDNVCPVIQVLKTTLLKLEDKKDDASSLVYDKSFEENLGIHWSFPGNKVILDFSLFDDLSKHIRTVKKLINNLIAKGVEVIPTVQINSPPVYLDLIQDLITSSNTQICLRASYKTGIISFPNEVPDLLARISGKPNNAVLLIDLGVASETNKVMLAEMAVLTIQKLPKNKWLDIVVASGSFPQDLTYVTPSDKVHHLPRFEWEAWRELNKHQKGVKYGDYGTKYPVHSDAPYAGTVSIKYSTETSFVIFKGKLAKEHKHGNGQYITHAKKLVASDDYSGDDFSWGDSRILEISRQNLEDEETKPGNPATWVKISQNHHITLMDSLL